MANPITPAKVSRIQELHAVGMKAKAIAVEVGIGAAMVESIVGGPSDTGLNGAAPLDEGVADSRNAALAAEGRAREARAATSESRARLEQRGVESELLRYAGDNPAATSEDLRSKLDQLVEGMHGKDLELLEQQYSSELGKQTDVIEQLRGRQPGTESELQVVMALFVPALERMLGQFGAVVQDAADRVGARVDRVGIQIENRLPPSGWPTIEKEPLVDPDKLLDSLVASSDDEVMRMGETLLGSEAAAGFSPDDLRIRLAEVARDDAAKRKPPAVNVTSWPSAPLPSLGQLSMLLQQLNLPDFRLGGQVPVGQAAPASEQVPDGTADITELRCPGCSVVNNIDLNKLRQSDTAFAPCFACSTVFDLSETLGLESRSERGNGRASRYQSAPRYRPS